MRRTNEESSKQSTHQDEEADARKERDTQQVSPREDIPALERATGEIYLTPWRTEPEVGLVRQEQLARYLATVPDITHGIYPFRRIKLNRADVEWLLAKQEKERNSNIGRILSDSVS